MFYDQIVSVGAPLQLNVSGRYFLLDATGVESVVTLSLLRGGSPVFGPVAGAKRGLKIGMEGGFDGVRIEAAGETQVRFFATVENVSISTTDGASVSVPGGVEVTNTALNAVPVDVQGAVLSVSDVEINNTPANPVPVQEVVDPVIVAGGSYVVPAAGIAVSTAASAARSAIHFRNTSETVDCYLAAFAAAAKADCPVLLRAGECLLIDDRSASAAWKAFSDGADITLKVQEVAV